MGKTAFIFSGQGAQYIGMGKELHDNYSVARNIFDRANEILGFDIKNICFNGPEEDLSDTQNTQPAILVMSVAVLNVLLKSGFSPDITAGLSLGEYSAMVCAGIIDFADCLQLVRKRGAFMSEAVPSGVGAMAAIIGLEREIVDSVCEESGKYGIVHGANYNCPGQIVISGEKKAVEKACEAAREEGASKAVELNVSGPFHSLLMQDAAKKLAIEVKDIELNTPKIDFISNVTADYMADLEEIKNNMILQVMSPVKWEDSIRKMINDGADTFIEVGPGRTLTGFMRKIDREVNAFNVEDVKTLEKRLTDK